MHPSGGAYSNLAAKILEKVAACSTPEQADNSVTRGVKRKAVTPAKREEWTGGSEQIAPRLDSSNRGLRGLGPGRRGRRGLGYRPARGFPAKGHWRRGW